MMKKIEFIMFIPIFIMLYFASGNGNIIIGTAGVALIILNALMVLFIGKKKLGT